MGICPPREAWGAIVSIKPFTMLLRVPGKTGTIVLRLSIGVSWTTNLIPTKVSLVMSVRATTVHTTSHALFGPGTDVQTRREYLAEKGLAKIGRGKFSTAAKEELVRARAAGIKFSDEVVTEVVKPTGETVTEVKPKPKADPGMWKSPDEYRYPEATYKAHYLDGTDKVAVSLREACQNCGLSLCDHRCHTPVVLGQPVIIERA